MEAVGYLVRISFSPQKVTHRCLWVIFCLVPRCLNFVFSKHQALPCAILSGYLWKKKQALNPKGWC